MPCNMIVTTKVEWSAKTDSKLVAKAFEKMGLSVRDVNGRIVATHKQYGTEVASYVTKEHAMYVRSNPYVNFSENEYKRAYSEQVLYRSAAMNGFQVQKTGQDKFRMVKNVTF